MFLAHLNRIKISCIDYAHGPGPPLQERVPAQTMFMLLAHVYRMKISCTHHAHVPGPSLQDEDLLHRPCLCSWPTSTGESSCTDYVHAPGPLLQDKDPAHASANAAPTSRLLSTSFSRHFCHTFRHYYVYDVTDTNCAISCHSLQAWSGLHSF